MENLKMVRSGELGSYDNDDAPFVVRWDVTGRCPYNCSYCYERESPRRRQQPSLQDFLGAIPKLADILKFKRERLHLYLFGGEPTAHPDFLTFLQALREAFPEAVISCLSNLYHSVDFLQRVFAIDNNFIYNVSAHFEHLDEPSFLKKVDLLAQQNSKGKISFQYLPSARERVRSLAEFVRANYPEFKLQIQFLRSRESNFKKHYSEYTEDDYAWAKNFEEQDEEPVFFIDYINEDFPEKVYRKTFTFLDAFHPELTNFQGAQCVFSMQRLSILLDGKLKTNFCLPLLGENLYTDEDFPLASAAVNKPVTCPSTNCACRGMRATPKWFDPRFAPRYLGGNKEFAHDSMHCEPFPSSV